MKLEILSWNIWERCKFELLKEFLAESKADIIGLQEVLLDDPIRDVVGFLTGLGYEHAIVPSVHWKDGLRTINLHNAIFCRHKIVENHPHILVEGKIGSAIEAKIQVDSETLTVFSTHLKHTHQEPSAYQLQQAENLLKLVPKEKAIVMGDFNALPESNTIKRVRGVLVNTDPSNKPTWNLYPDSDDTCPPECHPRPLMVRLDYIFTTNDIKVSSAEVLSSKASDHLPISVVIQV